MALKNASKYMLEFWTLSGDRSGVRYAIYDANNDAYLSESGEWVFSPLDADGKFEQPIIMNSLQDSGQYQHFARNFTTLSYNVSHVQLRLYPPESGKAFADDVSITEIHDFTMAAWVKVPSAQPSDIFFKMGTESGEAQGIGWHLNPNGNLSMGTYSSNLQGGASISPSVNVSDGGWHLAALSVDRTGNYTSYLDGRPVSTGPFTLGRLNNTEQFYIGQGAAGYFLGSLDEVRFYQRALSAAELLGLYNGRYQDKCYFNITTLYSSAPGNSSAAYNAFLRVRTLPPETVLSLPFDVNISSDEPGKITDYSSKLTPGTKSGAVWIPWGKAGGAYNFTTAAENKIYMPVPVLAGTTDFTMGAWIYPDSNSGTYYIMGNSGLANSNGTKLVLSQNHIVLYVGADSIQSNATVPFNSWTHVAATRIRGNGTLYINGAAAGNGIVPGAIGAIGWQGSIPAILFKDDFSSPPLDSAWTFTDPKGNSNYSLTALPGSLQINVPSGSSHDCYPGLGFDCPRVMRNANDADAVYETMIQGINLLPVDRSTYGIMLYQDSNNYMRFEFRHQFSDQAEAYKIIGNSGSNVLASGSISLGATNFLRAIRSGSDYTLQYSIGGPNWITVGSFNQPGFTINSAGLYVINAGTNPATTANFDYFSSTASQGAAIYGYFIVGAAPDYQGEGFNGLIDEPLVVAKALSAQEISGLYKDAYLLVNSTLPQSNP